MSIIISDTTPLRYLIEIEKADVLKHRFSKVFIPAKVADELQGIRTSQKVKDWTRNSVNQKVPGGGIEPPTCGL